MPVIAPERVEDVFDLDIREIAVVDDKELLADTGFLCTLFTCCSLTCNCSCTGC